MTESPCGEAASWFCLRLKGEGGSAAVRGLLSLVSSILLSFSERLSTAPGGSLFNAAWKQTNQEKLDQMHPKVFIYSYISAHCVTTVCRSKALIFSRLSVFTGQKENTLDSTYKHTNNQKKHLHSNFTNWSPESEECPTQQEVQIKSSSNNMRLHALLNIRSSCSYEVYTSKMNWTYFYIS